MAKFLIVYGTREGQTQKISEFMKYHIKAEGHVVDLYNCTNCPDLNIYHDYDGIIVGGPVHNNKFPKELINWVKKNALLLSATPNAFFSVCLGILEKGFEARDDEQQILLDFFEEVSWYPKRSTIFAGALRYSKYGWFTKWLMKRIAAKAGGGTDTTRDYEYTNWNEVREFILQFVGHRSTERSTQSNLQCPVINPKRLFS